MHEYSSSLLSASPTEQINSIEANDGHRREHLSPLGRSQIANAAVAGDERRTTATAGVVVDGVEKGFTNQVRLSAGDADTLGQCCAEGG